MPAKKRPPAKAKRKSAPAKEGSAASIYRVFKVLDLLLDYNQPVSIRTITDDLGIPKSTAYFLVNAMLDARYLESRREGKVYLGPRLLALGQAYQGSIELLHEAREAIRQLRDETGETVQLSVLEGSMMLVLLKEEGVHPVRIVSSVGSRVPLNWAAASQLLVSDLDNEQLAPLMAGGFAPSPTGNASMSPAKFVKEVREARKRGWAIELDRANPHAGCVAGPIYDANGRCVAAISIAAPLQRLTEADIERLKKAILGACERVSTRLGASGAR